MYKRQAVPDNHFNNNRAVNWTVTIAEEPRLRSVWNHDAINSVNLERYIQATYPQPMTSDQIYQELCDLATERGYDRVFIKGD